ncbi:unnamed protein product [Diatraea saccharalis]|uniref:Steroidogenic acute regulatory protein-like n=1 Tax=Diatraea saccharalis TaxID=40085 RepID=A0A9P0G2L2_9NEOP|nr:unnamed protein product [Diatraea saccharalis]
MTDPNIRLAAESLVGSITNPYTLSHSQSHSVNLYSEDLVAGHRPQGKMSTVRRFFCLFVTFDLLFTSLMWLICVMMRGETLKQIFDREIVHYDVKTSLFDVVMISTAGTCAFLIGKVFVFDWPAASQPVYQVFLIVTSFTLSWGEAWFLDFRVLPQEMQARQIIDSIVHHGATERTPLISHRVPQSTYGDSTVNWFSPVETPEASPRPIKPGEQVILTQEQIDEYISQADESLHNAWKVLHLPNWVVEKRGANGDVVESKRTDQFGKVYRFTGIVECPSQFIYEEFKNNICKLPEWNPTILKSELIKEIAPGVDLSYQVTAGGGRGVIAPRDFIILRRTAMLSREGKVVDSDPYAYITSGVSVQVPGYPPHRDMVRGENKVGCWLMKPIKAKTPGGKIEQHTTFQWLMCCDLKGRIPQFVLDAAFASVMLDYIVHVRKFAAQSKSQGKF